MYYTGLLVATSRSRKCEIAGLVEVYIKPRLSSGIIMAYSQEEQQEIVGI
jgi:hypothetical protein